MSSISSLQFGSRIFCLVGWFLIGSMVIINSDAELLAQGDLRSPSEIDGSRLPAGQKPKSSGIASPSSNQKAKAADALFRELDNLIPGDFEKGSEEEQSMRAIVEAFQQGKPTDVVKMVEEAAKRPGYPPSDIMLAALSFSNNDQKTGLILLERAAINHPENPAVYSAFARLAVNGGRLTDARVLFEKLQSVIVKAGLSQDGEKFYTAQFLDGMIDISLAQKKFDEARGHLERQRELLPDHPKVLMVSAELEFKQNDLEKCVEYLATMKRKYPQSRAPEAIVASWFQRTGDPEASEKWIRDAAGKYPKDPQVQLEFASWALNKEDFSTASAAVKKAEDVLMETTFSKNLKAKIAFAREAYSVAEAHYESLVSTQPMDSDLSNMYALTLVESNDQDKFNRALGIARRNLQAMPNNRVALASLGYIQMRGGDLESARASFAKASQLSGASPEIDFFISSYLFKSGEIAKAKQFMDRAMSKEGLFLYRSAAVKLQKQINASELPTPKKGPEKK
ncbi:MAG: tetratricopeptide repeat protein [Planctomycetota bacterium]